MKIVGDKLINTEEDNFFVQQYLANCPKIEIRLKETGETVYVPFVVMKEW